jgi:3-phosphoshikimate 1-carboxyvinyltransferase
MKTKIQIGNKNISGSLSLSGSKSISNRLLILQALSGQMSPLKNLSNSDDTLVLQKALSSSSSTIDVGIAGTAMRFLTSYSTIQDSEIILTGAHRMKERPIKDLVDALRVLGAEITYLENEDFPPMRINGKNLKGGALSINADISSQFISALLMVAPYFEKGIQLELVGEVLSRPYIEMTLNLMQRQGVSHRWEGNTISISPGVYQNIIKEVESDWSSISYWFEIIALSDSGEIQISQVDENSVQGDQKVMDFFQSLGVSSRIDKGVLSLAKKTNFKLPEYIEFDCVETPDLAQTLAATACGLGLNMMLTGLKNLPLKETNRLVALKVELEKCGAAIKIINNEALEIISGERFSSKDFNFETYGDHRMALCLAPLALKAKSVIVDDAEVINKSYKSYWEDLKRLSFDIHLFK